MFWNSPVQKMFNVVSLNEMDPKSLSQFAGGTFHDKKAAKHIYFAFDIYMGINRYR